jgi:hypothetical protein
MHIMSEEVEDEALATLPFSGNANRHSDRGFSRTTSAAGAFDEAGWCSFCTILNCLLTGGFDLLVAFLAPRVQILTPQAALPVPPNGG